MNAFRNFKFLASAAAVAAIFPALLDAQSFNELASAPDPTPIARVEGSPMCGNAAEFAQDRKLTALPGCVRMDKGGCLPGVKNCRDLGFYVLAGGKPDLTANLRVEHSIVALDDLGSYKAHAWATAVTRRWATQFREKMVKLDYDYRLKFGKPWELREHWKAQNAFREALQEAEVQAKVVPQTPNSKALVRALPSFRSVLDGFVTDYNKNLREGLLQELGDVDSVEQANVVLSYLQLVKDGGAADDSKVIEDNELPRLKVRTLVALRAQLTAFIEFRKEKAEAEAEEGAAKKAAEEAKRQSIKGDRLRFYDIYMRGWPIYGPGRSQIFQLSDFQQAPAMFTCTTYERAARGRDPGAPPTWEVRGSRFDGDKAVGEQYVATGPGRICPSSAFKLSAFDQ